MRSSLPGQRRSWAPSNSPGSDPIQRSEVLWFADNVCLLHLLGRHWDAETVLCTERWLWEGIPLVPSQAPPAHTTRGSPRVAGFLGVSALVAPLLHTSWDQKEGPGQSLWLMAKEGPGLHWVTSFLGTSLCRRSIWGSGVARGFLWTLEEMAWLSRWESGQQQRPQALSSHNPRGCKPEIKVPAGLGRVLAFPQRSSQCMSASRCPSLSGPQSCWARAHPMTELSPTCLGKGPVSQEGHTRERETGT